jgi:hypothetical protein
LRLGASKGLCESHDYDLTFGSLFHLLRRAPVDIALVSGFQSTVNAIVERLSFGTCRSFLKGVVGGFVVR